MLQLLGLETAGLNTVQYSNHAGYRRLKGFKTSAQQTQELFEGLRANGLLDGFNMMLTGYVPGAEELEVVGRLAKEVKSCGGAFWRITLPPSAPVRIETD